MTNDDIAYHNHQRNIKLYHRQRREMAWTTASFMAKVHGCTTCGVSPGSKMGGLHPNQNDGDYPSCVNCGRAWMSDFSLLTEDQKAELIKAREKTRKLYAFEMS